MTTTSFIAQHPWKPDPRRKRNRYFRLVHVRENIAQLALLSPPKGISFTRVDNFMAPIDEGSLVAVYGTDVNPNELEKRTEEDIDEFIAAKLHVINDKPKGYEWENLRKFETINTSEAVKQHAFNEQTVKILDSQLKEMNRNIDLKNSVLKSKPFNSEDVEEKLETAEIKIVEI